MLTLVPSRTFNMIMQENGLDVSMRLLHLEKVPADCPVFPLS